MESIRDKKLCFVVQRYGLEVNGGAELHCRLLAEHMKALCEDITILTTCAVDYLSWENVYPAGETDIHGLKVIRFPVTGPRHLPEFDAINALFLRGKLPKARQMEWLQKQGPMVPGLVEYIRAHKEDYDRFLFMTFLYYPTVMGIREVADKAVLIPTAHNDPYLHMELFGDVFRSPRAIAYNTEEERQVVRRVWHNEAVPDELVGVGVDTPPEVLPERFRRKYPFKKFILYAGRIEDSKNCGEMMRYFMEYKRRRPSDLKLVLMGKADMPVPSHPDICPLGFVSDEDKYDGMAAAEVLVMPSFFESLSMVVLEAMSVGTHVLVNGDCDVLRGHCIRSNGALYYRDYFEFEACLDHYLRRSRENEQMIRNAGAYVEKNYRWDVITDKIRRLCET